MQLTKAPHLLLQSDSSLAVLSGPSKVCHRDYLQHTQKPLLCSLTAPANVESITGNMSGTEPVAVLCLVNKLGE